MAWLGLAWLGCDNTLLMAGSNHEDNDEGDVIENKYVRRKNIMNRILTQWWDQWYAQVFSSLFPYNKWKEEKENLEPGDVCLLKYERKKSRTRGYKTPVLVKGTVVTK